MEALHELKHVPGAQAGCIAIIEVTQVFVRQLLIQETQRLQRFFKVLNKLVPPPLQGLDGLSGRHNDVSDAHFCDCLHVAAHVVPEPNLLRERCFSFSACSNLIRDLLPFENCDPQQTGSCGSSARSPLLCNSMSRTILNSSARRSIDPCLPSRSIPRNNGLNSLARSCRTSRSMARWRLGLKRITFSGLKEAERSRTAAPG